MNMQTARSASAPEMSKDDRVLPLTRIVAIGVILILLLAVLALYLFPDFTDQNFAWTIKPRMMAMAIGAGYLMGAFFFARVLTTSHWHHVSAGFLPITAFTVGMALATILHVDRFHQGDYHFYLWAVTYAITPFLVPFIWWSNQRYDPGVPEPNDVVVPQWIRTTVLLVGIVVALAAVVVFIDPQTAINLWPWALTPLTARILAGWMMLPAIGGFALMRESRWSGYRTLMETATVGALFFLIAMFFSWNDFSQSNPLTWIMALAIAATVVDVPTLIVLVERRRRPMMART